MIYKHSILTPLDFRQFMPERKMGGTLSKKVNEEAIRDEVSCFDL
jgi:hypothetical protein